MFIGKWWSSICSPSSGLHLPLWRTLKQQHRERDWSPTHQFHGWHSEVGGSETKGRKKTHRLHTSEQNPQYFLAKDVLEFKPFPYVNNIHMLYRTWQYWRQMAHSLCLGSCHLFKQLLSLSLKTLTFLASVFPPNFDIILYHILRSLAW